MAFNNQNYRYDDTARWNPANEAFEVEMFGQVKGNSEEYIDEFIAGTLAHGIFTTAPGFVDDNNVVVMDPDFIGKITHAEKVSDRVVNGHPAKYRLTVKPLAPVDVLTPTKTDHHAHHKKWTLVCRALAVSWQFHGRLPFEKGNMIHGISKVGVKVNDTDWQSVIARLTRE